MFQNLNGIKKLSLILILSVALLQLNVLISGAQGAQNITGLSNFVISENSAFIYLNDSLAIPFSLNLTSGTPGTTYLIVANGQALANNGIYVGINPSTGRPNYGGFLYINTNVRQGVVPGVYTLMIESGGADPIYPGVFNFTLNVINTARPSTTQSTSSGSSTSFSVTSTPTTIAGTGQSSNLLGLGAAGIIVILVIIIIVFLAIKAKK